MIYWIYQDCPLCGARKNWGEAQVKSANDHGIKYKKISFAHPKAYGMAKKALEHGIASYPFFTDGERFSKDIADFAVKEEPTEAKTKKKKTTRKKKKEADDGNLDEAV